MCRSVFGVCVGLCGVCVCSGGGVGGACVGLCVVCVGLCGVCV